MDKKSKLMPFNAVPSFSGEQIKDIFFVNISGGDKMFWIFESGRVLVMPVYRECPIQIGTLKDLMQDFGDFIDRLENEKAKFIDDRNSTIEQIKRLKGE